MVVSVSSFFLVLARNNQSRNPFATVRKAKVPPRVVVFEWLALRGRIFTMDNFGEEARLW